MPGPVDRQRLIPVHADKEHWDRMYVAGSDAALSWHQDHAERSLALIAATGAPKDAAIIDVGGGLSALTADLLARRYSNLWILDISTRALTAVRRRHAGELDRLRLLAGDVTRIRMPAAQFDIWHDRAVFHFLTTAKDRRQYVANALRAVRPGGHLVIATFAKDGPERCSGLPVERYDAEGIAGAFGAEASLLQAEQEYHRTPSGKTQHFVYCLLRRHS